MWDLSGLGIKPTSPPLAGIFLTTRPPGKAQTLYFEVIIGGSAGKESTRNVGDLGSIPGSGRSRGEESGYPLQYSGLENSMDCIVRGVAKTERFSLS